MKSRTLIFFSLVATALFYLLWWNSRLLPYIDSKIYDLISASPTPPKSHSTVVVEIDERSLKALGQWPWPRVVSAEIFDKIAQARPAAIVADVVFSEPDRTSPAVLHRFYHDLFGLDIKVSGLPDQLYDNDRILADTIADHRVVLPVYFSETPPEASACALPVLELVDVGISSEKLSSHPWLTCNLPIFQKNAGAVGHINTMGDNDGIFRRMPLIIRNDNRLVPALGLAAIGVLDSDIMLERAHKWDGDMIIDAAEHRFSVDERANALLKFYPEEWYERISAIDLLRGDYNATLLQGKFVFFGSNAVGLDSWHTISDGTVRSGVFVNATLVENFFNREIGVQPSLYLSYNFLVSLLIALALTALMLQKKYLYVIGVFLAVLLIASVATLAAISNHIYISIGYVIIPLASYLFVLAVLMFYIDYRDKKRFMQDIYRTRSRTHHLQSQLHRSQQEIEYQKEIMFHQSKLAAMGEMIRNIAHQWKQPLTVLSLKIQDLEDAYEHGELDRTYLSGVSATSMEQIHYMSKTIDDFQDFLNPNQYRIRFNVTEAVRDSVKLLSSILNFHRISCSVECRGESPEAVGVANEFKQVIINLINNAKDVLTQNYRTDGRIVITIDSDAQNAVIRIADNGGGISPEVIGNIFDPYVTTKKAGEGTGIGLYMSYVIVHSKMGGRIEAENKDGGAVFIITLPRNSGGEEPTAGF